MRRQKVVALAGGTGSAKLLRGLARQEVELTIVGNVGDNFWFHGAYVCPDIDIAMYTLAGIADERGWGIAGDTFHLLSAIAKLGAESWFRVGDRDLALSLLRTELLDQGRSLTEATARFCRSLGVRERVLPATDSQIETRVFTPGGDLHLQEFWVREKGLPEVTGVSIKGAGSAPATQEALAALRGADRVVICPANPITSVRPILAVQGMRRALESASARVVAVSPMVGDAPFSGPAGKLMRACGVEPSSLGVAAEYSGFVRTMLIDASDRGLVPKISDLGIECLPTNTSLGTANDQDRLAREALSA